LGVGTRDSFSELDSVGVPCKPCDDQNAIRCTRWFSVSMTWTRPRLSMAKAHGLCSCPGAWPGPPQQPSDSPVAVDFCTRLLPFSTTYSTPSLLKARS